MASLFDAYIQYLQYNEGGNVFRQTEYKTAPIKKEYIKETINMFKKQLKLIFPKIKWDFIWLGSTGKKPISGDIDIAISIHNLFDENKKPKLKEWELSEEQYNKYYNQFKKRAKTASDEKLYLRSFLTLIAEKIDKTGTMAVDTKSTGSSELHFSFPQYNNGKEVIEDNKKLSVQIDINIGDLDWLKFSYSSKTHSGNLKGLHRTQLIISMFHAKEHTFKHAEGVFNKATSQSVASKPDEAISLLNKLYKVNFTRDQLEDYHEIMKVINSLSKTERAKIIDIYLKILDSTRADIPEDLQDYWIRNQERLDLRGKYLPNDSKLISHQMDKES